MLRYIKEAPLDSLHDDVRALEGRRDILATLQKLCDGAEGLNGKLCSLEAELKTIADEKAKFHDTWSKRIEALGVPPYVSNGSSTKPKFHATLVDGPLVQPSLWRTRCGFRFAFCGFSRVSSLDGIVDAQRCKSCFPCGVGSAGSESSSSSASSSSPSNPELAGECSRAGSDMVDVAGGRLSEDGL